MRLKLQRASSFRPLLLAAVAGAVFTTTEFAKDSGGLHYLRPGRPNAVELLAAPPVPGSSEEAADLALVASVSRGCASDVRALALSEKHFSLFTFAPAVGGLLTQGKLPQTERLLERVQEDAAAVADLAKEYWKRPRPYTLEPSLAVGKLEKSYSYPSGHATEGMTVALVLAEVFPEQREAILETGRSIGWHRVCIARHYLTDIYAGRTLAQAIVRELKASPAFRDDLAKAEAEVQAAQPTRQAQVPSPHPVGAN